MKLRAHGIETDLPAGWEGRISLRHAPLLAGAGPARSFSTGRADSAAGELTHPVAHLANFALPQQRGDFGSGAVDLMGSGHVLVVLFEYGPESVGQALFRRRGVPDQLRPAMFSPSALQRTLPEQAGAQVFFSEAGRAFCLYVVLGRQREATRLVPMANRALSGTRISPR